MFQQINGISRHISRSCKCYHFACVSIEKFCVPVKIAIINSSKTLTTCLEMCGDIYIVSVSSGTQLIPDRSSQPIL